MIATRTQFNTWQSQTDLHRPFIQAAATILLSNFALFIGLSGQDENLQSLAIGISKGLASPFPIANPRLFFCEKTLSNHQTKLLEHIYGPTYVGQLNDSSATGLFAREFLGALYLRLVLCKIKLLVTKGQPALRAVLINVCHAALLEIENVVVAYYDAIPNVEERWGRLTSELPFVVSWFLFLYRHSQALPSIHAYESIRPTSLAGIAVDPDISAIRFDRLVLTLALFHEGHKRKLWLVQPLLSLAPSKGQLRVCATATQAVDVFVVQNSAGLIGLVLNGLVDLSVRASTLVVYPSSHKPANHVHLLGRRLPYAHPVQPPEIWLEDLIDEDLDEDQLLDAFRSTLFTAVIP